MILRLAMAQAILEITDYFQFASNVKFNQQWNSKGKMGKKGMFK